MKQGQQSWEYNHVDLAWPIVHAFLPLDKELNDTPLLKQKLSMLQDVECNNHLRGGIVNVYNKYDASWLIAMHKLGYKYACVWFEGVWPDNEAFNLGLLDEIDRYNKEDPEWIVAGQLQLHDDIYPYYTRSFIVINIPKWLANKSISPFWESAHHPASINYDSSLNHEDSQYRLNVDPDWKFDDEPPKPGQFMYQHNFGAQWIQWSFINNLTVWGISNELMDKVFTPQAYEGSKDFENGMTGKPYDAGNITLGAERLIRRLHEPSSPIYFVNTEPSSPSISQQALDTKFDQYVGCTAGFKLLYYAYKYGMTENTRFVWFDFDANSVQFKRDTIKHWDGVDFPKWVDMWVHAHPGCNDRLVTMAHERWSIVIDYFDGPVAWLEFWNKVKQCNHQYFNIDLIYDHDDMFKQMDDSKTLFWSSNIYSYITPKLMAKPFALETSFTQMIERVCSTHKDSWFSGTDINDNDLMCPANVVLSATDNRGIGLE